MGGSTSNRVTSIPDRALVVGRELVTDATVPLVAASLAIVAVMARWRGSDLAAQVFRTELVERNGFSLWNNYWYGGHHTAGYGILTPALSGVLGLTVVAVLTAAISAVIADRLITAGVGERRWAASMWFAVGTLTNVIVGRVPFALGMAVGLGALLAAQRRRFVLAAVLAVATAAASAVAAALLGLILAVWCVTGDRNDRVRAGGVTVAALAPVVVVAARYPQGGTFPFRASALAITLLLCAATVALVPARHRLVRVAAAVYAAAAVVLFVVPTPMGSNVSRLAMYAAGPVLLALVPIRGPRRAGLAAATALVVVGLWQWAPAYTAVASADEPSTRREFYEPLLDHLATVGIDELHRIEVIPTRDHWESAYIALEVPIARGWERQLDRRHHALFYEPELTPAAYRDWLRDNGVEYVALADAPLDPAGETEAELVETGLAYLELTWQTPDWRVWRVVGSSGMVHGPAELVELDVDSVVIEVDERSDVEVAVRSSGYWASTPPMCVTSTEDGWIELQDAEPGIVELYRDEGALVAGSPDDACDSAGSG